MKPSDSIMPALALLLTLAAAPVFSQISVSPNPAVAGDEIVLEVRVGGSCPSVSDPIFVEDVIIVEYFGGGCLSPPEELELEITLSPLDPGSYKIYLVAAFAGRVDSILHLEVLPGEPAGGRPAVTISPNPARSGENVVLHIAGYGSCPSVSQPTYAGKVIAVQFTPGICAAPERPFESERDLGRLSPGSYTLHVLDTHLGDVEATRSFEVVADPFAPDPGCSPSPARLCLGRNGRFAVEVTWRDFSDHMGRGVAVPFHSSDAGVFWFFSSSNWELVVKVLDGCNINDRQWVFASATTSVGFTLRVTDTETGEVREYFNPVGSEAAAIIDTAAFPSCS